MAKNDTLKSHGVGLPESWWPLLMVIAGNIGDTRNNIIVESVQKWMDEHPAEVEAARAMLAEQEGEQ